MIKIRWSTIFFQHRHESPVNLDGNIQRIYNVCFAKTDLTLFSGWQELIGTIKKLVTILIRTGTPTEQIFSHAVLEAKSSRGVRTKFGVSPRKFYKSS